VERSERICYHGDERACDPHIETRLFARSGKVLLGIVGGSALVVATAKAAFGENSRKSAVIAVTVFARRAVRRVLRVPDLQQQRQALLLHRNHMLRIGLGDGGLAGRRLQRTPKARTILRPVLLLTVLLLAGCDSGSGDGASEPDGIALLSLLPRNSPTDRRDVLAIEAGIEAVLETNDYRAGGRRITLIKGNSSDPSFGTESWQSCPDIGAKYAADKRFVGAIGPLTDECGAGIVPAFSQTGTALASPTATSPIFTHGPALEPRGVCSLTARSTLAWWGCKPQAFFPRGVRNFVLVNATMDHQGSAAAATFAQLGVKRIYVMAPYGYEYWIGRAFRREARRLGLRVVGVGKPDTYRPTASRVRSQARAVVASRADGLYLLGWAEADTARRDRGLAPFLTAIRNARFRGTIVGSFWQTIGLLAQFAPRAAEGMYYTSTRLPLAALPAEASALAARLKLEGRYALDAVYGAVAATVLLRAISSSDGTRAGVRAALFRFRGRTPVGEIRIDANGDVMPARIAIMQVKKGSLRYRGTLTVAR
jgi:hypothetical protein